MRILQVCNKPPYPAVDGGCMAMAAITRGLLDAGHKVKVLCMSTHKHPFTAAAVPPHILSAMAMEAVQMDVRVKPLDALLNLFSSDSYNLSRFRSAAFGHRLAALLEEEQYDIVHLESLFCAPYMATVRQHSNAKVVLRAHNVEHSIWQRLAKQARNPLKSAYLRLMAGRLRAEELSLLQQVDGIATITADDLKALRQLGIHVPMTTVPMGLDVRSFEQQTPAPGPLALYHLASMDWQPTLEAVDHFIAHIWPLLHEALPDFSVHFAGRNMPERLLGQHRPPLHVAGEVDSAIEFARKVQIMVVPLLSGGGMRVKIVEAMALGKVVLSTSIGAEGIPFTDGKDLLIANTPQAFVERMEWLRAHPEEVQRIGNAARALALREFDRSVVTARLVEFYQTI
jgi:polysaccharide biosynthesis protein PslH